MPTSFDPQQLPVLRRDSHLSPVPPSRLIASSLQQRFRQPPAWEPEIRAERLFTRRQPAHAAVLVPLVQRKALTVLLTRRADHLTDHPGQISFPGGRVEPEDVDAAATALREAREETGIDPRHVQVLGSLPTYTTGTGFIVTPVVGLLDPGFEVQPDPLEVTEVFEVPLSFLMTPANHRHHAVEFAGERREFLSMPWSTAEGDKTCFIWGATAAMLRNLYRFLSA